MQAMIASPLMVALFNLGDGEIILVLAIVLILFGAKKLPELARGLGQGISTFRRSTGDVIRAIDDEASEAGRSVGGIYGKAAAQALTPDNQVAELYDPAVFRGEPKPRRTRPALRRLLEALWRRILSFLLRKFPKNDKTLHKSGVVTSMLLAATLAVNLKAQDTPVGDATRGKAFFQIGCAVCHSPVLGPDNTVLAKQGPSLVGVVGRRAGSVPYFNYTKALRESGLTWNPATLYHFLENPMLVLPGTTMPIPVTDPGHRADVIAYLATLKLPEGVTLKYEALPETAGGTDPNDWQRQAPGAQHHFTLAELPKPYETKSAGNGPQVVPAPTNATLAVPPGFAVKPFANGLRNPRLLRTAPNGDIFIAETGPSRIRVMRTADGTGTPTENQVFAEGLRGPFGLSFYPPGDKPEWLYVANNNSVVRIPYRNGDLKARGEPEVIVPKLADTTGGHSTRDVVFSRDGRRMFISVGSSSNIAEEMKKKTSEEIQAWEAENGRGATWGPEWHRAVILVTDPEGHQPLRAFATGVRNGVGLAVNPQTGDLWVSTNERDDLGDELVPDYITRVKEGGYYGWPWFYLGNHEDPRHAGERPDLAGKAIVPDVLEASHSASLQMTFYTATSGVAAFPADYRGDAFVALHGSWNRAIRTGYKIIRVLLKNGVPTGQYDDFLTGFVVDNRSVWGRPVGVTVAHDGALLITEDGNGTMWRIAYEGEKYAKTELPSTGVLAIRAHKQ